MAQELKKADVQSGTDQYLTFSVNREEYAVDIMSVREIKGWVDVTRLPNTAEYLRGVMNLRGVIVPIFDLKCRFTGEVAAVTPSSVIIILAVHDRIIGVLVDAVSDILDVGREDVQSAPQSETQASARFISGLISLDRRMIVLLDLDRLFDTSDTEDFQHTSIAATGE